MGRKTSIRKGERDSFDSPNHKMEATSDYIRDDFDFNNDYDENQLRNDLAEMLAARK